MNFKEMFNRTHKNNMGNMAKICLKQLFCQNDF